MIDEADLLRKAVEGIDAHLLESIVVDAPEGWLRISTTITQRAIDVVTRANLGLVLLETGLAHVSYDVSNGAIRIAASLPAVTDVPSKAAVRGTIEHVSAVRRKIIGGEGEIRVTALAGEASEAAGPSLADVARVMGRALSLVEEKGSFVGGLRDPKTKTECALRLHTAMPGVLAADTWLVPPARTEPSVALIERLDEANIALPAGAMLLVPRESFVVHRWACPYRFLAIAELEAPAIAYTALAAFVRWRAS